MTLAVARGIDDLAHERREPTARHADLAKDALVFCRRHESESVGEGRGPDPLELVDERLVDSITTATGRLCPRPDQIEVRSTFSARRRRTCAVSLWSLPMRLVPGAARASPRGRRIARGRSPSAPTATSSTAVPTNAMSSLVDLGRHGRRLGRADHRPGSADGAPRRRQPSVPSLPEPPTRAQGVRSVDPATMLVTNHSSSIRATSMSAAVTSAPFRSRRRCSGTRSAACPGHR